MSEPRFVLSVKAVVFDEDRRCLLIRRSASSHHYPGQWEWPGGKVDPGEAFAEAVLRETSEETSLTVEMTGLAGATQFEIKNLKVVLLCMECRLKDGRLHLSDEHDEARWVGMDQLRQFDLVESVRDFMLDYASSLESDD